MEYKSNNKPYFLLVFIFVQPILELILDGTFDKASFFIMLTLCLLVIFGLADSFKTLFLEAEGIYHQKFYERKPNLLVPYDDIQSLTMVELNRKNHELEIFTTKRELITIKNSYPEFDDFITRLSEHHAQLIKSREHALSNSPYSQEASKGVIALFFMVFVVFIISVLIDDNFIKYEHLSSESWFSWILAIYPISVLLSFLLIRLVNKKTALIEALVVSLLLAPSLAGLGISINRYINENNVTQQIEIPVYLHENREETQVWQVDANIDANLPEFIKTDKRFYFDQPENTAELPKNTRKLLLAQHGKLNDVFITKENLQRLQAVE